VSPGHDEPDDHSPVRVVMAREIHMEIGEGRNQRRQQVMSGLAAIAASA
jgi:hypothetical protein